MSFCVVAPFHRCLETVTASRHGPNQLLRTVAQRRTQFADALHQRVVGHDVDGHKVAIKSSRPSRHPGRASNSRSNASAFGRSMSARPSAVRSSPRRRSNSNPSNSHTPVAATGPCATSVRTADQTELALFGTSTPGPYWQTNMRVFATMGRSLTEHARLMAMVWVAQSDAGNACFESKYFYNYNAWRPLSAITLADTDGNAATDADPAWLPSMPTPNHPEYPAAHSCITGAMAEIFNAYYGTPNITFDIIGVGPAAGITRHYTTATAMTQEIQMARIAGGMHFRTSTVDGEALGRNVAQWIVAHKFQPR
jgi:hypothetical protein